MFGHRTRIHIMSAVLFLFALTLSAATASDLVPTTAPHGARVIIAGTGLDSGTLAVNFASGGGTVTAAVVSRTASLVEVAVPSSAVTGQVTVASNGATIGSFAFTVANDPPFAKITTLAASDKAHDVFKDPSSVAVIASSGVVVVADRSHHQLRLVSTSGQVTLLAGTGKPGFTDGVGAQAQFKEPGGIAIDQTLRLIYVADTGNNVIRRVTFDGVVSTLAGSGHPDDANGSGALASFKQPTGLAIDGAGNLLVADTGNSKIKVVSPAGLVTTIAGGEHEGFADGPAAQSLFKQPEGVAISASGVLFVADTKNNVIRRIENGLVSTLAGTGHGGYSDGAGNLAEFKEPSGIGIDGAGNVFIADTKNHALRKVTTQGDVIVSTIAGNGKPGLADGDSANALFNAPSAVVFAGALFIADTGNDAIRIAYANPSVTAIWPRRGPAAGGNTIRIFGTGFAFSPTVTIGDDPATDVTLQSSTELTATVPAGSGSNLSVMISIASGSATLSDAYSYVPPPTITSISPAKGPIAGGTLVTIVGSNFVDGGDTHVSFGGHEATNVTVVSSNTLTALAPAGSSMGSIDVRATTVGGEAVASNAFTYFAPPTIVSFSPASGKAGTIVTIFGTNFDPVAADNVVRFGAINAVASSATSTQLVVTVPAGATSAPITVTTVGGSVQSAASFAIVTYVSLSISPDPASVDVGKTLQLTARGVAADGSTTIVTSQATWTSSAPTIATIDANGNVTGLVAGTSMITATLGTLSKTVTLTVQTPEALPPDPRTVATPLNQHSIASFGDGVRFLFTGSNPIQTDVAPGAISDERIAVIRGRVSTRDGAVLPGVTVRMLGHTELGRTLSRADGVFDLAVNGGGVLTIIYEKKGYLSSQRTIDVPWQDFVWTPDVALIPLDAASTAINLTSPQLQMARGRVVTDATGTRQTTLLFSPGTTASLKMPDGSTTPISQLTIRATEYTVGPRGPNAMPGTLPPSVAYTWCVDLHADEAEAAGAVSVLYSKPVSVYSENFIGLPVGTHIPVATYDPRQGKWMPDNDGRVMKLLAINGGAADLDTNGDGVADSGTELAALGIDDDERRQLASLYTVGQSMWRVRAPHFSILDANVIRAMLEDETAPDIDAATAKNVNNCSKCSGSIIEVENLTVGEAVPITGTPYSLVYNSGRVAGRAVNRSFDVTVSNISARSYDAGLTISIAGKQQEFVSTSGSQFTQRIDWDGRDAYDRVVTGSVMAHIVANASYALGYGKPQNPTGNITWGRYGTNVIATRQDVVFGGLQSTSSLLLGDAHTAGENGWMLDMQQHYDPAQRILYSGAGSQRSASDLSDAIVRRSLGTGSCCYNGENKAALEALVSSPSAIRVTADGSIYFAESRRVRVVSPSGVVRMIAGNGTCCYSGDGGPAINAQTNVAGMAVAQDGTVYIADFSNRLRMVKDGIITTIAGNGLAGPTGDNGPATAARVSPQDAAVTDDGTIYISEKNIIRRITPDGIISSYINADNVRGLSVGPDNSLYYTDAVAGQVYRMSKEGKLELVAGRATCAGNFIVGDGGKATDACLKNPWYAAADRSGVVYIAERDGARVRAVSPDGTIRTVAGTGNTRPVVVKDVLPAAGSVVNGPFGVAAHPNGMLYFSDWGANVVWRVEPKLPGGSLAGDILVPSEDGSTVSVFHGSQHARTVDALTGVTLLSFAYDAAGRLTSVTDLDGNITTFDRDPEGNLKAIIAPNGQRSGVTVTDGLITKITNPANGEYRFDYFDGALMKSMTSPRGMMTTFAYDLQGRLSRDTDAASGFQSFVRTGTNSHYIVNRATAEGRNSAFEVEYAPDGAMKRTITSPASEFTHDDTSTSGDHIVVSPDGTRVVSSAGPDSRFGMAAPGSSTTTISTGALTLTASSTRQTTLISPSDVFSVSSLVTNSAVNGRSWQSSWDAASRTITRRSPLGRTSRSVLDAKGRAVSVEVAGLTHTTMSYDSLGRMKTIQSGTRTTTLEYDARRHLAAITDPLHRTIAFRRDDLARIIEETLPGGRTVGFTYDADGNLTSITPPSRPTHAFEPTRVDLLSTYSPPSVSQGGATHYGYNRDRQLTRLTRPDGSMVMFAYDAGGRPSVVTTPTDEYGYTYASSSGLLSSIGFSNGASLSYLYNGGLLKTVTWSGAVQGSVNYTYDNSFRLASENGITFTYDNDDLLTSAGALMLQRDPQNGLITGTTLGSVSDALTYNEFGEALSHTVTFGDNFAYSETFVRDDVGRIASRDEMLLGATTHDGYYYDPAGRLQTVTRNGASTSYLYDANSNRKSVTKGVESEASTYDDQDRLLTRGNITYSYEFNGELKSKTDSDGITTYQYDALGNLRGVTFPDGTIIDYVIDGAGRRVGKKINGVLVAGWLYADQLRIVAELDGAGAIVSQFVYGSRSNSPDYMIRGGITYRLISDHIGSPRAIINVMTGAVAQMIGYDEFGNVLADTAPGFQPFGFAGGLYDRDTRLVRFGARDYDLQTGRWTIKDPIGFGGLDTNVYSYVTGDPINLIDPRGLSWDEYFDWLNSTAGQNLASAVVGFGDASSFGATKLIRSIQHQDDVVDTCSGWYWGGYLLGAANNIAINEIGYRTGYEFKFGKNLRIAPWGNRTGHEFGENPHYHRRGIGEDGETAPGQGIGRHRPWETKSPDTSFWDRF